MKITTSLQRKLLSDDTIVFLGDSITAHGDNNNKGYEGYLRLIRNWMQLGMLSSPRVICAGRSGDKVPDCQLRLESDVLSHRPTIVFIYIGINDVWHKEIHGGTPIDQYKSGLIDIVSRIHAKGSEVVLCTPSVIGEKRMGQNHFDNDLEQYSSVIRAVAGELSTYLIDFRLRFTQYLQVENVKNIEYGVLTRDGVHLNAEGNRIVAIAVCQFLNLPISQ